MADERTAPTTMVTGKAGRPIDQHNGLLGAEDTIIGLGVSGRFTAIVTFEVADIITSVADRETHPTVAMKSIEPLWTEVDTQAAQELQESAYKDRTGANQLNFDGLDVADSKVAG